ncbi:MAG TPA: hypothetical protein PLT82_03850 [Candidatus Hydrogenedens sp.]|nr:hypothetical protein [Candidatus Hydrogenedens sp.]HOK10298.1 hypothetical protein [Candidatus Hydrogenedens sp.]HOL19418.1 hypothetical protein [Candidatus Hydrogenedens sp.]HPP58247.1 hypothetical protein [Candidatus Hydrogenedens sp.]
MIKDVGAIKEVKRGKKGKSKETTDNKTVKKILLFGKDAEQLIPLFRKHPELTVVRDNPDYVLSYGGDGTLLASEHAYPYIPKIPVLNSMRGHRCIPHPPEEVIARLAEDKLIAYRYMKLTCSIYPGGQTNPTHQIESLNEITVAKGRINSAVRFKLWVDGVSYEGEDKDILGDGFMISTPFGSTAYFSNVTRGIFWEGIGIAFLATSEDITHMVLPEKTLIEVKITRGPAILAYDNIPESVPLEAGDILVVKKSPHDAIICSCGVIHRPSEPF